ncbi:Thiamine-phosphate synthase [Campylobacter majalis]|uniref:Thiamine-phosphate synthase n=1 Tax=Campylobacter majalis TaxID=2790656 RepID=A0ABM8Q9I6_9BACT|nr:thiamine phosphate synthase [Campylobacter majalis]CAD7289641.1 Thiamine-phosphate synthase [Campylobacter majalis]
MKILIIADVSLCFGDFETKISRLCRAGADAIVLRAKNLKAIEYERLAIKVLAICDEFKKEFVVNQFIDVAHDLSSSLWLTSQNLDEISLIQKDKVSKIYAPAHDMSQAKISAKIADTLIASHIFNTKSKPNQPPKGTKLINELRLNFTQDIFALGGINAQNFKKCISFGANGICLMHDAMMCDDEKSYLDDFKLSSKD